jgi:short-subunit dehydrogenase
MEFFTGCTALITGASSGLGSEFARQLAPYARTLILVARRSDRLQSLRHELTACFPNLEVHGYTLDLTIEADRSSFVEWLTQQNLSVDLLINNAGLGDHGTFAESEYDRVRAMIETNITALTHLTHLLVPQLLKRQRTAILNVSSVAGFFPLPNLSVYSATKAYVTSFSESLAIELRPHGITVTALCPGPVPTEFFDVATRPGEANSAAHFKTMPALAASPQQVVYDALLAVARDRRRVIPNPLLALAVGAALLVPFFITRKILATASAKL